MTDLVDLCRRVEEAKRLYEAAAMRNRAGASLDHLVDMDIAHSYAHEQLRRAEAAYRQAVEQAALAELDGPA